MWMMHRLASSKSWTKYASAASYRVKIACTWKCILYCPTSRTISWTRHEKGNFQIRWSVLFWNQQISWRAAIPGQYLWGFFTLPAFRNSFWGALPPMVSLSFLLAGSCPPDIDDQASTASGLTVGSVMTLAISPKFSTFTLLLSISLRVGGTSISGTGGSASAGGSSSACPSALVLTCRAFLPSPVLGVFFVLAILEKKTSQSEARVALQESLCSFGVVSSAYESSEEEGARVTEKRNMKWIGPVHGWK